jgi:hypothetical protein
MSEIWVAGYRYQDDECNDRWAELEGRPLFTTQSEAKRAALVLGKNDPEPRVVDVFEYADAYISSRTEEIRQKARRKLYGVLTDQEMKALGL